MTRISAQGFLLPLLLFSILELELVPGTSSTLQRIQTDCFIDGASRI